MVKPYANCRSASTAMMSQTLPAGSRMNAAVKSTVPSSPMMNSRRLPMRSATGFESRTPTIVAPVPKTLNRLNMSSRPTKYLK